MLSKDKSLGYKFLEVLVYLFLFFAILLLNDFFLFRRIKEERNNRITELQEQMKNLQSRINLNASVISATQ